MKFLGALSLLLSVFLLTLPSVLAQDQPQPAPEEPKAAPGPEPGEEPEPVAPAENPGEEPEPAEPVAPSEPAEPAAPGEPAEPGPAAREEQPPARPGEGPAGKPVPAAPAREPAPAEPAGPGPAAEPVPAKKQLDFHDAVIGKEGWAELFLMDGSRITVRGQEKGTLFRYDKTDVEKGLYFLTLKTGSMELRLGKNPIDLRTPFGDFLVEGPGSVVGLAILENPAALALGRAAFTLKTAGASRPRVFLGGKAYALPEAGALEFDGAGALPAGGEEGAPAEWQRPDTALETGHYVTGDDGSVNLNLIGSQNLMRIVGNFLLTSGFQQAGQDVLGRLVTINSGKADIDCSLGGTNVFVNTPQGSFQSVQGAVFSLESSGEGLAVTNRSENALSFEANLPGLEIEGAEAVTVTMTFESGTVVTMTMQDGMLVGTVTSTLDTSTVGFNVDGNPVGPGHAPTTQTPVVQPSGPSPLIEVETSWTPEITGSGQIEEASPFYPKN